MVVGKKHQSQEEQPRKERMVVGLGVCLWWRFCGSEVIGGGLDDGLEV